jgi:hypothetical protein
VSLGGPGATDGKILASGGADATVRLWDLAKIIVPRHPL